VVAQIAVTLSLEKHVHGGVPDFQDPPQGTPFQVIQTGPLVHGLPNKASEILGQLHE
jgi:hypothetical protein